MEIVQTYWRGVIRSDDIATVRLMMLVFLVVPLGLGGASIYYRICLSAGEYGTFVSAFSIFAAFLFAAQISAFSIYRSLQTHLRRSSQSGDRIYDALQDEKKTKQLEELPTAFKYINAAISYLILLAVSFLTFLLSLVLLDASGIVSTALIVTFASHFLLTLLSVLWQCFVVFDAGYTEG